MRFHFLSFLASALLLMVSCSGDKKLGVTTERVAEKPSAPVIGGQQVVTLAVERPSDSNRPSFLKAEVLPGRGMNTFQITAYIPGKGDVPLLASPSLEEAQKQMSLGPEDVIGNKSFSFGGAILVPYANRITGALSADRKTIDTQILGKSVTLPANWGGKKPGARQYAMHGLILASPVNDVKTASSATESSVTGLLHAGNFGGHWLSKTDVQTKVSLRNDAFELEVTAKNMGDVPSPIGIGWHPYFALPSGDRRQARLHLPARKRAPANNYDEVLPTGKLVPVKGTAFDFSAKDGAPLKALFLDDSFTDLQKTPEGHSVSEILDPAAHVGIRITALSKEVNAIQVYAPVEQGFVVLEPQFNLADPFSKIWKKTDSGMVTLKPGESVTYRARLELFPVP